MQEKLLELLENKKYKLLHNTLTEMNEVDIAECLDQMQQDAAVQLLRVLPKGAAADVFAYLSSDKQEQIIAGITDNEISQIVEDLYTDDAADFLEEMPANVVQRVLANTKPQTRDTINRLLKYPNDSAGSIMTTEFVGLKKARTVKEAISYIRHNAQDKETIYTCYVTDAQRKLEGVVTVKDLLLAKDDQTMAEIMDTNILCVNTKDDRENVGHLFRKYDLLALPVVDDEGRLVGIITIDDAVDAIQEENTEDIEKMAAVAPSTEEYLKTGVLTHTRNRIVWLLFLMVSATFTGAIINGYNKVLESYVVLAAFVPMLMDTGGNAGSQVAALVIRGMALNEIRFSDILKVMWKEFRIGLLVGLILAVFNYLRILWFYKDSVIAGVVAISLFSAVVLAKLSGACLPMLAKQIKLDPAMMASPLITTMVDAISVFIYFSIATAALHIV